MGNYNPRQPYILGEEWVPIRDERLVYSPNVNSVELGTAFTLATARQVRTARFYVNTLQPTTQAFQTALVNIYPYGLEDQTGPIREVIIPVTSAQTTGSNISFAGGAASGEAALAISGDGTAIEFDYNATVAQDAAFWFGVSAYPELANKRILNVSLVYTGHINDLDAAQLATAFVDPDPATLLTNLSQRNDLGNAQQFTPPTFYANTGVLTLATSVDNSTLSSSSAQTIEALSLGDINSYYETAPSSGSSGRLRRPWRYADLLKFEQTYGSGRQHIWLRVQLPTTAVSVINPAYPQLWLDYLAMRVIYCEEKRVAYGAQRFSYAYGVNQVSMYDLNFNADPVLPAGQYLPTLSWVNPGQVDYGQAANGDFPDLNALRELYQIPSHPGVQVNVPFPLAERLGDTFVSEVTHILPQLSLHASGGTLTEPHVYGRQVAAQVYGVNAATQEIYDDISGVAASYPQVRYYARRFGDTTIPLTLTGVGVLAGSTAAITVADFDALTEILDGWKEVTLRFATPPSMGTVAGNPGWTWSAVSETSGNRWEILGASAPAVSGTPGNRYNLAPLADRLGTATYQPPAGDTVELTWMPQGISTPWVTGAAVDAGSDAVLIFSQDPPTVTGLALSQLTQAVSGIGALCGSTPCCIPTGIGYHQVSWSAQTALPVSGFGAYELQRWDSVTGGDFATIMLSTTASGTSFRDYEARVGVTAVYRIRTLNVLNFAGLWSTYVSGAPPAPGVTGGCGSQDGVLIFTSNSSQAGADNAAYVMQWDNTPNESFDLPESDMVTFQPMYGRDGSIAFHGTERGLEEFSRQVLLAAGAIALPSLADASDIRDLAWAQLPYVCVRDDRGNRWFSNVRVNGVNARNNAQNYTASLAVTETTRTPYPVQP